MVRSSFSITTLAKHVGRRVYIIANGLCDRGEMSEGDRNLFCIGLVLVQKAGEPLGEVQVQGTSGVTPQYHATQGVGGHDLEHVAGQQNDAFRAAHRAAAFYLDPLVLVASRDRIAKDLSGHPVGRISRAAAARVVLAEGLERRPKRLPTRCELHPPAELPLASAIVGDLLPAVLVCV